MIKNIYQLKITLNDSDPKTWRRILVPKNYSFFDLHCAIQDAMGWAGGHLHAFYIAQKGTAGSLAIQFPYPENDEWFNGYKPLDERKEKIADYFGKKIKQCQYCYDFGDSWDHTILLERELSKDKTAKYPVCLTGQNACPPEDCGGLGGYDRLQTILKNPKHKEYKEICQWLGIDSNDEFDPHYFRIEEVYFRNPKKIQKEWEEGIEF